MQKRDRTSGLWLELVLLLLVFFLGYIAPTFAATQSSAENPDEATSTSIAVKEAQESSLSVALTFEQYFSHTDKINASTQFYVDGIYRIAENHKIRLVQGISKLYEVDRVGGDEFQIADTSLYHYFTISGDFYGIKGKVRGGFTLPLSEKSQRDGVVSVPNIGLELTRGFFKKSLTLSVRPYLRYYLKRYTSTIGGIPLTKWALRNVFLVKYDFLPKLAVGLWIISTYKFKETIADGTTQVPSGSYEFDGWVSYDWNDHITTRLGIRQADSLIKEGRYEINLYDPANTQFYAALDLKL